MKNSEIHDLFLLNELSLLSSDEQPRLASLLHHLPPPTLRHLRRSNQALLTSLTLALAPKSAPRNLLRERVLAATDPTRPRVVTNPNGAILAISKPFSGLCGYSFDEIRGKKPGSFLQGPETDPAAVQQFRQAIASRSPATIEILNYHKSGSRYWVRVHLRPVLSKSGILEGFAAIEEKILPCNR